MFSPPSSSVWSGWRCWPTSSTSCSRTWDAPATVTTLSGGHQVIPGGLVASQEAVKELGTNGDGYFGANSAHPSENPNGLTNLVQIFLLLVIPFSLPRTYGAMVGDRRQGHVVPALMATLWALMVTADDRHGRPQLPLPPLNRRKATSRGAARSATPPDCGLSTLPVVWVRSVPGRRGR